MKKVKGKKSIKAKTKPFYYLSTYWYEIKICHQRSLNITKGRQRLQIHNFMNLIDSFIYPRHQLDGGLNTQNIYDSDLHKLYLSKVIENNSKFIGVHFTELFIEIFNTWCMFHSRIKFSLLLTTKLYINTKKAQEANKNTH